MDFEGVPKSVLFASNKNETIKKGVQGGVMKKHVLGMLLDAKMGGLEV